MSTTQGLLVSWCTVLSGKYGRSQALGMQGKFFQVTQELCSCRRAHRKPSQNK